MASKHKAPTQVTLVQQEKSTFAVWVENNWRMGAAVALGVSILILGSVYFRQKKQASTYEEWDRLRSILADGKAAGIEGQAPQLGGMLGDVAWMTAAGARLEDEEYTEAIEDLGRVSPQDSLLRGIRFPFGAGGEELTVIESAQRRIEAQRDLVERIASNPPPPADAPRVVLEVAGKGKIVVALYPDKAPKHVENFMARVDEQYYDGLKFHRVDKNLGVIQTGDPNTRDGDPSTWGTGGPEQKVEAEADNGLVHVPFAVGMARSGSDPMSSGSQFYITLRREHQWDGSYTVFGVVLGEESIATVRAIGDVPVEGTLPTDPPVVTSARRE